MSTDDEQERLLAALRAPGSDVELTEEERYRAMFRAHSPTRRPARPHSRTPSRFLVGGTVAAVLAVGTGGVAAAYSGKLPEPIQTLAHHVIGAPGASAQARPTESPGSGASTRSSPPSPATHASRSPSGPTTQQRPRPLRRPGSSTSASAHATASGSPGPRSTAPSVSTTPTRSPAPVLTGVQVVGAVRQADVGARVRFTGRVSYSDGSTPPRRVVLQERLGTRWTAVDRGRSKPDGSITLATPSLERTGSFRLLAGRGAGAVRSDPWRVAMRPRVTASSSSSQQGATIDVTAVGGAAGDVVGLTVRRNGHLVTISRARLDASGSASFDVTVHQRRTRYVIVLAPTARHTAARTKVVVPPAQGTRNR